MNLETSTSNFLKVIIVGILIIGLLLRIFFQFYEPAFYLDEIHLGFNIKNIPLTKLLLPPDNFQSAPPLYLLSQKLLIKILPFPFWIKIKILSTFCALASAFLFYRITTKTLEPLIGLLVLAIFLLNPYIIYNSLTVKQYTIDLLGLLILINFYKHLKFKNYLWLFFMFWILFSNAALFCFAGYVMYEFIISIKEGQSLWSFFKSRFRLFLAPIPYIGFFLWYSLQNGIVEQQNYMLNVWRDTFFTFDLNGLRLVITFVHVIYTHMFSIYELWGIVLLLLFIIGLVLIVVRGRFWQFPLLMLGCCIFMIHFAFNALHLYPIVERSILYLAPFFILILGYGTELMLINKKLKFRAFIITVVTVVTVGLYITYLPQKKNDVVKLYKDLNKLDASGYFYITPSALTNINKFNQFTENAFERDVNFMLPDTTLKKSKYLVSWVHKKLKAQSLSNDEPAVRRLLKGDKIKMIGQVDSFNIFLITN